MRDGIPGDSKEKVVRQTSGLIRSLIDMADEGRPCAMSLHLDRFGLIVLEHKQRYSHEPHNRVNDILIPLYPPITGECNNTHGQHPDALICSEQCNA